jgi:glycerol-3-phosphate acyltransferase PlsY
MILLITGVLAYLLGSVPFGILITRVMGIGDLRQIGSGNIGATNVLRTGNKLAAFGTLVLDGAKGAVAVLVARAFVAEDAALLAGLMAFLGHLFPIWLRFRGGKGVATFLGTMLALAWPVGLGCCATWLVAAYLTRIPSMASLLSAALSGLWVFYFERFDLLALSLVFTILVYVRHWSNLQRLRAGTEPKFALKKA